MGYESSTYFYDPEMLGLLGLLGLRTGGRDVEKKHGPRAMEIMEELRVTQVIMTKYRLVGPE